MKRTIQFTAAAAAVAALAVSTVPPAAPAGPGDQDPARRLLEQSVEAIGGQAQCESWKTMVARGELTVHWPGWGSPKADATLWVKRPDKMVLDQDFSANDHPFFFTYYYNAGDVWAVVNLGVRQNPRYTEMMTRAMKNQHSVCYFLAECDTVWVVPEIPDDSLVVGATVDRIGVVDVGDTIVVDLDKKTHLPVRQVEDGGRRHTLFGDWRETGGDLLKPHRVTVYQNGSVSAEYRWEEFEFNVPLKDELFEKYRPQDRASG